MCPGQRYVPVGSCILSSLVRQVVSDIYWWTCNEAISNLALLSYSLSSTRREAPVPRAFKTVCEFYELLFPYANVILNTMNEYNQKVFYDNEDDADLLFKNLQHERLYKMMKPTAISRDRTLWSYLEHYADHRSNQIQRLDHRFEVETQHHLERVIGSNYDEDCLKKYSNEDPS